MPPEHETVMMELRKITPQRCDGRCECSYCKVMPHLPLLLSLAEEGIKAREWVKDARDCTGDDGHVHGHDNNAKMDAAQAAWNEAIKRTDSLIQKKEDRTDE